MTKAERAFVEAAVLAAYGAARIDPEDEATWDATPQQVPTWPDVLAELERKAADEASATARGLAERLAPFCRGTLAGLFSGRTSLKLGARLTSFDLEGLDSELRPLAVWLIGDFTWKLAKRDRKRRILSMDEVKTLLEYPESARLVAHLYTLGRAYNLSVWSATQLLSDYTSTPGGSGPCSRPTPCSCSGRRQPKGRRTPAPATDSPRAIASSSRAPRRGRASCGPPWGTAGSGCSRPRGSWS
jgi:type IV secretory pathway VirB4 component